MLWWGPAGAGGDFLEEMTFEAHLQAAQTVLRKLALIWSSDKKETQQDLVNHSDMI